MSFLCSSSFTDQAQAREGGCQRQQPAGADEEPNPPGGACSEDVRARHLRFLDEDGVRQHWTWVCARSILFPSPFPSPGRSGVRVRFCPFCRGTTPDFYPFTPFLKDFMRRRIPWVITFYLPQRGMDHAMNLPASSEESVPMAWH